MSKSRNIWKQTSKTLTHKPELEVGIDGCVNTVCLAAWPSSSEIAGREADATWTAGSALSLPANADGSGRLERTMRRGSGRVAMSEDFVGDGKWRK